MNCIDKMYKEVEEIKRREEQDVKFVSTPKNVKFNFLDVKDIKEPEPEIRDYSKEIDISDPKWVRKYLTVEKVRNFMLFVFKKYLCFYDKEWDKKESDKFLETTKKELQSSEEPLKLFPGLTAKFLDIKGINDWENSESFFLIPYNALFSDENGVFAVIEGNKYSDVPKPQSINPNQVKKVLKDVIDVYFEDLSDVVTHEKEKIGIVNNLKGFLNKCSETDCLKIQKSLEDKIYQSIQKFGINRSTFDDYVKNRGLRLIKQGNIFYREGEYKVYGEYRIIEFRY